MSFTPRFIKNNNIPAKGRKPEEGAFGDFGDNLPLKVEKEQGEAYPLDALGDCMSRAAHAIHLATAAPIGICAQCVLSSASLAVGSYANVLRKYRHLPLNNFYFTVGESGSGKTSAHNLAMKAHKEWSVSKSDQHREWEVEYKNWKRDVKDNPELPEPIEPISGSYLPEEPTYEAAVKTLVNQPYLGIYTDEAGRMLSGFSMSGDQRVKSISGYSSLWDGGLVTRSRVEGNIAMQNRRLSMHLMCQPVIAEKTFFSSSTMKGQGFMARFLMCSPAPVPIEKRFEIESSEYDPAVEADIAVFSDKIALLLDSIKVTPTFELSLMSVSLSDGAEKAWLALSWDLMQKESTDYKRVIEIAARVKMHAIKLAATIELMENALSLEISEENMVRGITLARYYFSEAIRLIDLTDAEPDSLSQAAELEDWMRSNSAKAEPNGMFKLRTLYRDRVCGLTTAKAAKVAIQPLIDHGRAREHKSGTSILIELSQQ